METFSALLAICAGNLPVPVNSPHKGQWRGALMSSLICAWINRWVNNREAGDLRRYRTHYAVTIMLLDKDKHILQLARHMVRSNPLSYASKPYTEWLSFPVEDSNSWGHHGKMEMVIHVYSLDSWPTPNHDLNQWCILVIWTLHRDIWNKNTRSFIHMLIFCRCVCCVCVCVRVCAMCVCGLSSICALYWITCTLARVLPVYTYGPASKREIC